MSAREQEKTVVLNLAGCQYVGEIHQRIKEAFDFPDFYGENWHAFYDLALMDSPAETVIVCGVGKMSKGLSRQLELMVESLEKVKKRRARLGGTFEYEIQE